MAVTEVDANFGTVQQVEDGAVPFQIGAGGVTVRVARTLVALSEKGVARQILGVDAQLAADVGVNA